MIKLFLRGLLLILIGLPVACAASPSAHTETKQLTIFAASSLNEAFSEIGDAYHVLHPETTIVLNLAGSQQLLQQLVQGAPADIFASASSSQMDKAVAAGLINPTEVRIFTKNKLVIIAAKADPALVRTMEDLANPGLKLVLAAKEVPAGAYALQFLENTTHVAGFPPDFKEKVLTNIVSYEENVRAVFSKVTLGEADAGIVYHSDVTASGISNTTGAKVAVVEIPDSLNIIATYPVAVLTGSSQSEAAQQFIDFLLSHEAQSILAQHGFTPVSQ